MSVRTTIDFGIHLGITHAEIAVLRGTTADLIKNNEDNEPGKSFRCPLDMERVAAGLRVTINTQEADPPARGHLSINGSKFVEVEFPLERRALPVTGELTLALAVDGFTVLDSTQRVVLVDREMTDVVFTVERRSWMSRMFSPSERHTGKE